MEANPALSPQPRLGSWVWLAVLLWAAASSGMTASAFAEPADAPAQDAAIDAIAVCPPALRPALDNWLKRRAGEGLTVRVITPEPTAAALRKKIAELAQIGRTRYIVLIGDTQQSPDGGAPDPQHAIPTIYRQADATAPWQSFPQLPGDYLYGDFNDDGVVNAAVGRLPVRSVAQATQLFNRIAAYEDSRDFGDWRSRVDLVAGLGGFGPLIDGAIETIASGMISGSLPGSVRTRITHAGPESLFCPGTDCFTETVLANYTDGARFWVYAGHGHVLQLDRVPSNPQGRPVLTVDDVEQLRRPAASAPIALLLACYTGAYDATEDCLAKRMLLAPGGPVAVLAGSRVTMPYGNAAAAMGLIHSVYHRNPQRLGDAWRETLVEMATPSDAEPALQARRLVIDGLATLLGDGRIDDERREHMQLYNWLGDPTMRLAHPKPIDIDQPSGGLAGQSLTLTGTSPLSGTMTVELHRRLGTSPPVAAHPPASSPLALLQLGQGDATNPPITAVKHVAAAQGDQPTRYALANDTTVSAAAIQLDQPGRWEVSLPVPADVSGPLRLVVKLQSSDGFASGSQTIWVRTSAER